MAGSRGHRKSSSRSNAAICVNMPTIPKPTIVSPQQGGTSTDIETPPATPNQGKLIVRVFLVRVMFQ